jgi:hypothetical protein
MLRERREHDAARGDARGRGPERAPAAPDEPARDGRVVGQRPDAGRSEGHGAREAEVERDERARARYEEEAGAEHERPRHLHPARAVAVDDPSDDDRVAGSGELHRRERARDAAEPAERLGERREEDAPRVEEEPRVDRVADEGDEDDPPAVEDGPPRGASGPRARLPHHASGLVQPTGAKSA